MQPEWELIGTFGDVDPLGYGGGFVFRDKTGVYAPELEYVQPLDENDDVESVKVYRVILEPHTYGALRGIDGILSDNPYHPEYPVWYASDLDSVCKTCGCERRELIDSLCGADPMRKAWAYETMASYFGWHEFDCDPLTLTPDEAVKRYAADKYQEKFSA